MRGVKFVMKPGKKGRESSRFRKDRLSRVKRPLTRKERRKQERTARRQRAVLFHSKIKSTAEFVPENRENSRRIKKKLGRLDVDISKAHSSQVNTSGNEKEIDSKRSMISLSAAVIRENKEIARLEKLLKMKKRKKLPTSFKEEGLDCILKTPRLP